MRKIVQPDKDFVRNIRTAFDRHYFDTKTKVNNSYWIEMDEWVREKTGLMVRDFNEPWQGKFFLIDERKYLVARLKYS